MSESPTAAKDPDHLSREEAMSGLFANLVLQQANLAMMFLGKVPHPETGKSVVDLEAAQLFIDNLEMIELKTQGNLTKDESGLLKQSLMSTRMTFVQAAASAPVPPAPEPANAPSPSPAPPSPPAGPGSPAATTPVDPDADERRKFVKKY